jgi:hypothetical protein
MKKNTKWKSSKEVLNKKKALNKLLDDKKKIELEIKKTSSTLEEIENKKFSEDAMNKLPIESLQDLYHKNESPTEVIENHSKERKKQLKFFDEISSLEHEIYQAKIDLTIEKINNLLEKIN